MKIYHSDWEQIQDLRAQLAEAIELRDQWAAACGEKNAELASLRTTSEDEKIPILQRNLEMRIENEGLAKELAELRALDPVRLEAAARAAIRQLYGCDLYDPTESDLAEYRAAILAYLGKTDGEKP